MDGVRDTFGECGAVLGAAGGFEIDRADPALGTPASAVRLASAKGFGDGYQFVLE